MWKFRNKSRIDFPHPWRVQILVRHAVKQKKKNNNKHLWISKILGLKNSWLKRQSHPNPPKCSVWHICTQTDEGFVVFCVELQVAQDSHNPLWEPLISSKNILRRAAALCCVQRAVSGPLFLNSPHCMCVSPQDHHSKHRPHTIHFAEARAKRWCKTNLKWKWGLGDVRWWKAGRHLWRLQNDDKGGGGGWEH